MVERTTLANENYVCIQGFMVNELNLKGNELIIYAIIYGFSQINNHEYNGSLQYLANWTNSTKYGVMKNLKSLVEKDLIGKKENYINGVKFVAYYATKLHRGMQQSCINNIINNKEQKKDISKDISKEKKKFGEFENVFLTDEQYQKLKDKFYDVDERIETLSAYIASKGVKYKDHYATILTWARKEKKTNTPKRETPVYIDVTDDPYFGE